MLKKWLREPLLHFLLIGGSLFLLYGLQNDGSVNDSDRIVITKAAIDRLRDGRRRNQLVDHAVPVGDRDHGRPDG